jgi:diacylglycerol kinase family enzyme
VRALLVVNPKATATTVRGRDVLARALGSDLKLDVAETGYRGHAIGLAAEARRDGLDAVVALGGDGTVNEVVNGLLLDGPGDDVPALAAVPGGSVNVFTRALGLSRDPIEATSEILDAIRSGRRRRIGLGRADDRWFTFCAGLGLDAEVVREVEAARRAGRKSTPALYIGTAIDHFFTGTDRRHPTLTLHRDGDTGGTGDGDAGDTGSGDVDVDHLFLAIVSNASPWTYAGNRPVHANPGASFDGGLGLLAQRRLGTLATLRTVTQMLRKAPETIRGRGALSLPDLDTFQLSASRPVALQVDGDYLGEVERVRFTAVRNALDVLA